MGQLRKIWLQMNCFVSKQPNLGEQIIIVKSSSITAVFEQLAREIEGLGKWAVTPLLSFPSYSECHAEVRNLPPGDGHSYVPPWRGSFPRLFLSANLGVAGKVIWRCGKVHHQLVFSKRG